MPNNAGFPANHPYYCPPLKGEENGVVVHDEESKALQVKQTEALVVLSEGVKALAEFVTQGGLQAALAAHTKGSIIQAIFGGLAAKEGRGSLDARVIKQNSLEIVEVIEQVFSKMHERMQDKGRDSEIKDGEEDLRKGGI